MFQTTHLLIKTFLKNIVPQETKLCQESRTVHKYNLKQFGKSPLETENTSVFTGKHVSK